jgi:general stress protein 26
LDASTVQNVRLDETRKVRSLIQHAAVAMLVTSDDRGGHAGRPMLPLLTENDPHIYFLTHRSSKKVAQIRVQPEITLTITTSHSYLVVIGRAEVDVDRTLIARLWHPTYRAWFPGGKDDRDAAVLRVVVERIDYWETPRSRLVRIRQAVKAFLTGKAIEAPMHTIHGL